MRLSIVVGLTLATTMSVLACRSTGNKSELRTIEVPGSGLFRIAYAESGRRGRIMQFYTEDAQARDIAIDANGYLTIEFEWFAEVQTNQPMTIYKGADNTAPAFPVLEANRGTANPARDGGGDAYGVNYGWQGEWSCADAKELVQVRTAAIDNNDTCTVQFNTEDDNWYSVAVLPKRGMAVSLDQGLFQALNNARVDVTSLPDASVPQAAQPGDFSKNPLKPGQVNAGLDDAVKLKIIDAMTSIYAKSQTTTQDKRERNTCLKNGRAQNWLDLQAHFYCMLPYNPTRKCYSTPLVEAKPQLAQIADPGARLFALTQVMWKAYGECRRRGKGLDVLTDDEAAVFKQLMFVYQGAMDYNLEDTQDVINKFYQAIGEARPRRVADRFVFPWTFDQGRYNEIMTKQAAVLGLAGGGGGTPPPGGGAPPAGGAPTPVTSLTPALKAQLLATMRANRTAFQEQRILDRYQETRPPLALMGTNPADGTQVPVFAACGLPRKAGPNGIGEPLADYPAVEAEAPTYASFEPRTYPEGEVVSCLDTRSGLAGDRPEPLQQHYYCSLPGFSPDIRGCFTFQIRVSSETRSAVDDEAFITLRNTPTKVALKKFWEFNGTDQEKADAQANRAVPAHLVEKAFKYCAEDGRPAKITRNDRNVRVTDIHPQATKPMCYVALTQQQMFQMIMGGIIDIPVQDQIDLLNEYYDCPTLSQNIGRRRDQISQGAYNAYCDIDPTQWN